MKKYEIYNVKCYLITLHINMLRKLYNYLYHDINHNSEKQWIREINNLGQKIGK